MKTKIAAFVAIFVLAAPAGADEASLAAATEIDALLEARWKQEGVKANAPASDETFLRRIYLDLAGRIPTPSETVAFLESKQPDKRSRLIDDLLQRESYVANFFHFWADILRFKSQYVNRANVIEAAYAKFIQESLRSNKPYDQFVRDMLSAKGYAWHNGAIGYYSRDPEMPLDNMAITSRIFLGTRIECAQCHDHPFDKWKQTDFYRLAAFTHANASLNEAFDGQRAALKKREDAVEALYRKEKALSSDGGKDAAERRKERLTAIDYRAIAGIVKSPVGQLFSPIGIKRDPKAMLKLPANFSQEGGKPGEMIRPASLFGPSADVRPGEDLAEAFARWVTSPENPRFTKVIVNRVWKKMFSLPVTESFDDLRDNSESMIPELESHLEKLLKAQKYDLRAFLAVLANTRAYQSAVSPEEHVPGKSYWFTGPVLRRMTAEQAWDSLVALASWEPDARDLKRLEKDERRIAISQMAFDAYRQFDGEKLLEMALHRMEASRDLNQREFAIREATIVAKRKGDVAKVRELDREGGKLAAERGESMVKDFILPLLDALAKKAGPDVRVTTDLTYKMNPNPRILPTETWRRMYIPGYGPPPKSPEQATAEAKSEKDRWVALAGQLGYESKDQDGFVAYCERIKTEWLRASELESPAPRGHFLRTMGQSDREFVENANPNASIAQALALMNSDMITEKALLSPYSPLMRFVTRSKGSASEVESTYLAILSRKPTAAEREAWARASARGLTTPDLIYALLNTKHFLFVQ
jgi:hypothetical protein